MRAKEYTDRFLADAVEAGNTYGVHPLYILAQGAVESGWGESLNSAPGNYNFFGIIATKSWKGRTRKAKTGLTFRCYESPRDSFRDFARLISSRYSDAAKCTTLAEYASAIAASPYISEDNGDNRENYERMILNAARNIWNYLPTHIKEWKHA